MSFLEFGGEIIHSTDIVGIEEKVVTVVSLHKIKNPVPKPKKGMLAKLLYTETIEEKSEKKFKFVVIKIKNGMQITTNIDGDTGKVRNNSHQLYDFYAICNDQSFLDVIESAENKIDVELEIGNFYCYPGMLQHSDYIGTHVKIDSDITSKSSFMAKYM